MREIISIFFFCGNLETLRIFSNMNTNVPSHCDTRQYMLLVFKRIPRRFGDTVTDHLPFSITRSRKTSEFDSVNFAKTFSLSNTNQKRNQFIFAEAMRVEYRLHTLIVRMKTHDYSITTRFRFCVRIRIKLKAFDMICI